MIISRLLFARVGKTICFQCGKEVKKASTGTVVDWLENQPEETKFYLTFPLHIHEGTTVKQEIELLKRRGFFRIYFKEKLHDINVGRRNPQKER